MVNKTKSTIVVLGAKKLRSTFDAGFSTRAHAGGTKKYFLSPFLQYLYAGIVSEIKLSDRVAG
ncbi:hypothetical protein DCC81_16835 [Chitinophaga parva]|uniref:Uncharacterized protein n=1 Tax=Chitinophaga parva TaxID=2169414 RepID=A0A2T7BI20_9BACT|nr:hypothetical protein DCC81_16835 [Chitinophaga parva]